MKKLLVTGGCGFIGSNFIHYIVNSTDYGVVCLDSLTYAGNVENISCLLRPDRVTLIIDDIRNDIARIFKTHDIEAIINFAAESHVDNSIKNPDIFIDTNITGTLNLLKYAKEHKIRYVQISTDEVYGALKIGDKPFTEETNIKPNSPYSASKASADHLVMSYYHTFGVDTVITRCSNNYGAMQFPEKMIPKCIMNAFNDKNIPVYGKGEQIRDWIHVNDHCKGILKALLRGKSGEVYNFGGGNQLSNIELVKKILKLCGKSESLIQFVDDRLGHDFRYEVNYSKSCEELKWQPLCDLDEGLEQTVEWYRGKI